MLVVPFWCLRNILSAGNRVIVRTFLMTFLALLVLVSCSSQRGGLVTDAEELALLKKRNPRVELVDTYRIGVDDRLQISVWRNPELSVTVPVRPDGMASVPLVGDVHAGGFSPEEVSAAIEEELARYIRGPKVTVILTGLVSHEYLSRVRVTGAVRTPISTPYRPGATVLDLVLVAGGINEFASPNKSVLYRTTEDGEKSYRIRLGEILKEGKLDTNYFVQPGDVIIVPEKIF